MEKLKLLTARLREPSSWLALTLLLALFGLPAPVVAALGALLDVAPQAIDTAAAIGAAAAAVLAPENASAR